MTAAGIPEPDETQQPHDDAATASGDATPGETTPGADGERQILRDLIVQAHPDVVPELIRGDTVAEMLASLPEARAAYARVVAQVSARPERKDEPQPVPAGGGVRSTSIHASGISAFAKIRHGLERS